MYPIYSMFLYWIYLVLDLPASTNSKFGLETRWKIKGKNEQYLCGTWKLIFFNIRSSAYRNLTKVAHMYTKWALNNLIWDKMEGQREKWMVLSNLLDLCVTWDCNSLSIDFLMYIAANPKNIYKMYAIKMFWWKILFGQFLGPREKWMVRTYQVWLPFFFT